MNNSKQQCAPGVEQVSSVEVPTNQVGFFSSTDDQVSKTIERIKVDSRYKAGESIYIAGELPLGIYSIREGVVKVELLTPQGQVNIVNFLGAGGLLGYRSFFRGVAHLTTAVAVEDCLISFLPAVDVKKLFESHRELTLKLISKLADDVREAELKWLNQINKSAPARIAEALLFLDEHFVDVHWTRKEIAEWAGTTPETVIRTLSAFESAGIIQKNSKNFSILNHSLLLEKSYS